MNSQTVENLIDPRRKRKAFPDDNDHLQSIIQIKSDLNETHISVNVDISQENMTEIYVPKFLRNRLNDEINKNIEAKIQFKVLLKLINIDGKTQNCFVSQRVCKCTSETITKLSNILNGKVSSFLIRKNGWKLDKILEFNFTITRISDMTYCPGRSYIKAPNSLTKSKAIVNVKNNDDLCFIYSILAVLKYQYVKKDRQRVTKYKQYLDELKYDLHQMPMELSNIPEFEKENKLSINVFTYKETSEIIKEDEIFKNPFINSIYRTKNRGGREVNLLLLNNEANTNSHYLAVTNLERLLNLHMEKLKTRIGCKKWCHYCLHGFATDESYENHKSNCNDNETYVPKYTMPELNTTIEFTGWARTIPRQFVVYCDFEYIQNNEPPIGVGLLLIETNQCNKEYHHFSGENCVLQFLQKLDDITIETVQPWYDEYIHEPIVMTPEDENDFQNSNQCYLCKKVGRSVVRDHDHRTGKYLGAACDRCNFLRSEASKVKLPIVVHNLRGHDMHNILHCVNRKFKSRKISITPISIDRILAFLVDIDEIQFRFFDSLQFLPSPVDLIAENAPNLPITSNEFSSLIYRSKRLLLPNFITSLEQLNEIKSIPDISQFDEITENQYGIAQSIWNERKCANFHDYVMTYLKLNVFLLADVFEAFRKMELEETKLDPVNFLSNNELSWFGVELSLSKSVELMTDQTMFEMIELGIRQGISFINKQCVTANEFSSFLYIHFNNLHDWALCQRLPCSNFKWIENENELSNIIRDLTNTNKISSDSGYILEVDLSIPLNLHRKFDDLPLAPEVKFFTSSYTNKLILNHDAKKKYVVHWRLLEFYLKLGIKVDKIFRAIKFDESSIFENYIQNNFDKSLTGNSQFERDFYKMKNRNLYEKIVNIQKNKLKIKLCNTAKKLVKYTSQKKFNRSFRIGENLISLLLYEDVICLDQLNYIQQAVMDLSKLRMYQLQYEELEKYRFEFICEINLVAGETDSLFLECRNVDVDNELIPAMIRDKLLDTSNYENCHRHYSKLLANEIGTFQNMGKGNKYIEWIFLRPKCYSLLLENDGEEIQLSHKHYKEMYQNSEMEEVKRRRANSEFNE